MVLSRRSLFALGAVAALSVSSAMADAKNVAVGYQTDALSSSLAIADGEFDGRERGFQLKPVGSRVPSSPGAREPRCAQTARSR